MVRRLVGSVVACAVVLITATAWQMVFRLPASLLAPGAADVRVAEISVGRQVVTYTARGLPYAWRSVVASRLIDDGYRDLDQGNPFAPHRRYARVTDYPLFTLLEQIDLFGEPERAYVVRRWRLIAITWHLEGVPSDTSPTYYAVHLRPKHTATTHSREEYGTALLTTGSST